MDYLLDASYHSEILCECTDLHKHEQIYTEETENIEEKVTRNNLIIWDWDDTIFPTYSFMTHQDKKDKQFMDKLKTLVLLIEKIFSKMIQIYGSSNIIILTNASENWIYKCLNVDIIQHIFMNFQNLLQKHKIKTISASTKQIQKKFPKNPYKWKRIAFEKIFKDHFNDDNKIINCITSIGDSLYEYKASHSASKYISNRVLNRIRFKSDPSINDMIFELKQTFEMIEKFGNNLNDIQLDYSNIFTPTYYNYSSFSDTTC